MDERHPTQFSESKHDLKLVQRNQLLGPKEKIPVRRVSVLRREIERQPERISFKAPDFQAEVSGFWRRLTPGQIGADKYGRPIHGRTWIKQFLGLSRLMQELFESRLQGEKKRSRRAQSRPVTFMS